MDVTRERFTTDIVGIIQDIADSHFVAFDLEFSGVAGRSARLTPGKPSLQELYQEAREAAESYQILQFGLTVVLEDTARGCYILKPYNFDLSQVPTLHERYFKRTWSMNSGAIGFLLRNGFDFGKQLSRGIHFLSRKEEDLARQALNQVDSAKRPDMTLKPEDDILIDHIRKSVKLWLEIPEVKREVFLNIPSDIRTKRVPGSLNRYQVRLTHQIVQNEFPGLKTQSMNHFVQITKPSDQELQQRKADQEQNISREIAQAVGFRWLLEALAGEEILGFPEDYLKHALSNSSDADDSQINLENFIATLNERLRSRRRVLVGHNCFTDLINLHQFMMGWLPETVEEFADSLNALFPAIVDTKHIASFGNARWGDTSLAKVEEDLRDEIHPPICTAPDFDRYRFADVEHEAGYDSMLTAKIAIRASIKMAREGVFRQSVHTAPGDKDTNSPIFGLREGFVTPPEASSPSDPALPVNVMASIHNMTLQGAAKSANVATAAKVIAVKELRQSVTDLNSSDRFLIHNQAGGSSTLPDKASNSFALSTLRNDGLLLKNAKSMPGWDDDFWAVFGNRLQVNGCKEGICQLRP